MIKSPLAIKEILTNNYNERKAPIIKYTLHHVAVAKADGETIAKNFNKNGNSANYVICDDGTIILCVPEEYRAWTSGSEENDTQSITVEMCNSTGAPEWRVSEKALESAINLGVDICRRHGLNGFEWTGDKNGTLTIHKMFEATACPGPYLESKMPYIAEEITRRLKGEKKMIYNINIDELKRQGYTEVCFKIDEPKQTEAIPQTPIKETFEVGQMVALSRDAVIYGTNDKFAQFVYGSILFVREIDGDRVIISTQKAGAITGATDIKYLKKYDTRRN